MSADVGRFDLGGALPDFRAGAAVRVVDGANHTHLPAAEFDLAHAWE